jgi:hypothetical protein
MYIRTSQGLGQVTFPLLPPRPLTEREVMLVAKSAGDLWGDKLGNIDVYAQWAIVRLSKNPSTAADAHALLDAVKSRELRGIFIENQKVPALRAQKLGTWYGKLIPAEEDAVVVPAPAGSTEPPLIAFRDRVKANPARLDPALVKARRKLFVPASGTGCSRTKVRHIDIYMIDRAGRKGYDPDAVRHCLGNMFDEVCRRSDSTAKTASVSWIQGFCPDLQPHDVIVYILKDHGQSIIKKVYKETPKRSNAGLTHYGGDKGSISEVYLDHDVNKTDRGLTYLIYHELLHNKRQQGDSLHFECGAGTTDIASRIDTAPGILQTRFGECDKKLMAPCLSNKAPQFCA